MTLTKEYLPIMVAIIAASLAYLYAKRNNKLNNFYAQAKESLEGILGSMYFDLRNISQIEDEIEKDFEVQKWFNKHGRIEMSLFKLGDPNLINSYLDLEKEYRKLKNGTQKDQKAFYINLERFYSKLDKHYWNSFQALYNDYNWFNTVLNRPFPTKIALEIAKHLQNFSQLIFSISAVTIFFGIYFRVLKGLGVPEKNLFWIPIDFIMLAIVLAAFSIMLIAVTNIFLPGNSKWLEVFEKVGNFILSPVKKLIKILKR
ncbi:hypothetical protein ACQKFG_27870 [Peribacillus sp. NPDC076916]|uniref:hypothetical protein n=1 Tax=Peribacillus sp. NPDC076916 TaxID=3390608 RepID=UPI003CFEB967